jgi:hypothetical protein
MELLPETGLITAHGPRQALGTLSSSRHEPEWTWIDFNELTGPDVLMTTFYTYLEPNPSSAT